MTRRTTLSDVQALVADLQTIPGLRGQVTARTGDVTFTWNIKTAGDVEPGDGFDSALPTPELDTDARREEP